MSMHVRVDEVDIAEAIVRGDISLSMIISALRGECSDDEEFFALLTADLKNNAEHLTPVRSAGLDLLFEHLGTSVFAIQKELNHD